MILQSRQYNRDLRIQTKRPAPPRNLVYDDDTQELSWTGPNSGPLYTHFNIRLDDDSAAPAFCVPIGTSRLVIQRSARVSITCWNEISRTESDAARLEVGSSAAWAGSSGSTFGTVLFWEVDFNLTANITITSPIAPSPRRRLLIWIFQHATVRYNPSFDPAFFVDTATQFIDPAKGWVREFAGKADAKWYPIGPPMTFDPAA